MSQSDEPSKQPSCAKRKWINKSAIETDDMQRNKKSFANGDVVFAKLAGYSAWPAMVQVKYPSRRYLVIFFGTHETAIIKVEDIEFYNEKTAKRFNIQKSMNKSDYVTAVEHAEAALNAQKFGVTPSSSRSSTVAKVKIEKNKKPNEKVSAAIEMQKKRLIIAQQKLLNNIWSIKVNLEVEKTDVGKSVELLNDLKTIALSHEKRSTKFILLKYPYIVKFIERWKTYEGEFVYSQFDLEDDVNQNISNSLKIRELATEIYEQLQKKLVFTAPDGDFQKHFEKQAEKFKEKVCEIDPEELFMLTSLADLK